jgi:predicted DNA-binding transcriptional regulator AlpA
MKHHGNKTSNPAAESDTRNRVRDLRSADLFMKMSEIARIVGVSRQRVYQILQEEGLPTKQHVKKCLYACPVCGRITNHKFCSGECRKEWLQIPVICSECGNLFIRSRSKFMNSYPHHSNVLFCSKKCTGKWLNKHYASKCHFNSRAVIHT